MRILVADDDVTSLSVLAAVVRKFGHEVIEGTDGNEAWQILAQPDAPRMAILDWMMPHLSGIEICRRLGGIETDLPPYVILLTALADEEHAVQGLDSGANDFLTKPFRHTELRARIAAAERMLQTQERLHAQSRALREALAQVKTLRGFIPICAHCRRVRDDRNYWRQIEEYVSSQTEALFSHGLCPDCLAKHYPENDD
jgi:DNA-binding response OmpR family regulator